VTVTATMGVAEGDGAPGGPVPGDGSFVESLVARLHAEYGVDPEVIRGRATDVLATFAGARVRAFVPILVEKRLRELYRGRGDGPGADPAAAVLEEPHVVAGVTAVAGRRRT
jgi:hypothetical protein